MNINIFRRFTQVIFVLLLQAVLLFVSAGTTAWLHAWLFLVVNVMLLIINLFVIPTEVIEERGRRKENVKQWDKTLNTINILPTVCMYTTAGLDYRLGWTGSAGPGTVITGFILVAAGSLLFTWSMISNPFFSTMVRLQRERGQTVAHSGPYGVVRHPGYVGYIIMSLGTPLALSSAWALVFAGITGILLVIRTALEDKTLRQELAGYEDYTKQVRFRLAPFIW